MDELIIEEKVYVSSKRAAKITGYAKDYIGQLCREGRVPARLVGRNWYVLNSAIQDHRFGKGITDDQEKESRTSTASSEAVTSAWASPRYHAVEDELLPRVSRIDGKMKPTETMEATSGGEIASQPSAHQAWIDWFDTIAGRNQEVSAVAEIPEALKKAPEPIHDIRKGEGTSVPIHVKEEAKIAPVASVAPPPAPAPKSIGTNNGREVVAPRWDSAGKQVARGPHTLQKVVFFVLATVVCAILVVLVAINSPYFNRFLTSYQRVSFFSGITVYDR